ncbi:MAG TPA: DUF5908 family protein [Saprospiraceae bacterium]|nr:DUF5908 family protein [Saprospiraceae bacterium]
MPIEIKELHIKVTVNANETNSQQSLQNQFTPQNNSNSKDKEAIIAESIEQVLQILHDKNER